MVYNMRIYVDGAYRNNGMANPYGAAAAVSMQRWRGRYICKAEQLPSNSTPRTTNQRAEITAIILALRMVLDKYNKLHSSPRSNIRIFADSKYAVNAMNERINTWIGRGWTNSSGTEVGNQDLFERAKVLRQQVEALGRLSFVWIPRAKNTLADRECNEVLNEMK